MRQFITPRNLFIISAIFLAAITRLIPHPFNFTAVGAMALFGGACISDRRVALLVPVLAMLLSDLVLGFHSTMLYTYGSFILITFIGMYLGRRINPFSVILGSLSSSVLFFLITNFGVWMNDGLYSKDLAGLIACYAAAIPFASSDLFGSLALNTVLGDLFYNGILFGSLYLASLRFPRLSKV